MKAINITREEIMETGFDFNERIEYTGEEYAGQQGKIVGFDGDFPRPFVYVEWDNPSKSTSAACVSVNNIKHAS